jgi:hypothetical protein
MCEKREKILRFNVKSLLLLNWHEKDEAAAEVAKYVEEREEAS